MPAKEPTAGEAARTDADRSALLLGATGLVGRHCLELLLGDGRYEQVIAPVRHPTEREHPRLEEHRIDFDRVDEVAALFLVRDVFCCLGTTIRAAGSREAFRRVDVELPARTAELAARGGARSFVAVSAVGADPDSRVFYSRAKGEMEARVAGAGVENSWFVRPSLLLGERADKRPGERMADLALRPISPLMRGPLRRYRPIQAAVVAAAMLELARRSGGGILESERIPAAAADYHAISEFRRSGRV